VTEHSLHLNSARTAPGLVPRPAKTPGKTNLPGPAPNPHAEPYACLRTRLSGNSGPSPRRDCVPQTPLTAMRTYVRPLMREYGFTIPSTIRIARG
jgi:hypothetical protein